MLDKLNNLIKSKIKEENMIFAFNLLFDDFSKHKEKDKLKELC